MDEAYFDNSDIEYYTNLERLPAGCEPLLDFVMRDDTPYSGVYALYNVTKDKYYVGQSHDIPMRIKQHLRGKGNPDVYFDLRNGDEFAINTLPAPLPHLNYLEALWIALLSAYSDGYNKTRGITNHPA